MSERVEQAKQQADAALERTRADIRAEVESAKGILKQLREDVRQKLVVAGMEAKEEWSRLEIELAQIELAAQHATEQSKRSLHDAAEQVRSFAKRL